MRNKNSITSLYFVVKPSRCQLIEISRWVEQGDLKTVIDSVFPLKEAQKAFERILVKHGPGKIVLQVVDDA